MRAVCAILLIAVLLLQGYTLLVVSQNHKEAIERHGEMTRIELANQEAFVDYMKGTVEHWEAVQAAKHPSPSPNPIP